MESVAFYATGKRNIYENSTTSVVDAQPTSEIRCNITSTADEKPAKTEVLFNFQIALSNENAITPLYLRAVRRPQIIQKKTSDRGSTQLAKLSVDPKFVELTADVVRIILLDTYSSYSSCEPYSSYSSCEPYTPYEPYTSYKSYTPSTSYN